MLEDTFKLFISLLINGVGDRGASWCDDDLADFWCFLILMVRVRVEGAKGSIMRGANEHYL